MTFLAPLFLAAAGVAAVATVVLHLLAVRRPRPYVLPTARFAPDRTVRSTSFAKRPSDLLLLAMRVLALLLIGAAFARPVRQPERAELRRVILVDRSAATADPLEVRDSVMTLARAGDMLVTFGSSAAEAVAIDNADSLTLAPPEPVMGSITTALVAGLRAAASLRDSAERVELVLVSPVAAEELDAATLAVRAQWPGALRLVRTSAALLDSVRHRVSVSSTGADPVAAGAAAAGAIGAVPIRILRDSGGSAASGPGSATAGTSSASITDPAPVIVHWPEDGVPRGWETRSAPDTVGGVTADAGTSMLGERGASTLVAPFVRHAMPPGQADGVRPLAWWADGEVAALERPAEDGCVREVGVVLPDGDLVLRPAFAR